MESRELALLCYGLADNKKAENIVVLDVRDVSSVTDYFVIANGTSDPHLKAILDELNERLRQDYSIYPHAVEGNRASNWVVLDYIDVIVHVMRAEVRENYDLEGLWGDVPRIEPSKASAAECGTHRYSPSE